MKDYHDEKYDDAKKIEKIKYPLIHRAQTHSHTHTHKETVKETKREKEAFVGKGCNKTTPEQSPCNNAQWEEISKIENVYNSDGIL